MPDPFYFWFSLQRLKNAKMWCRYAHLGVLMISCLKMYAYAYDLSSLFWVSVKNTKITKIAKQMPKHANKNHEKGTCFFSVRRCCIPKCEHGPCISPWFVFVFSVWGKKYKNKARDRPENSTKIWEERQTKKTNWVVQRYCVPKCVHVPMIPLSFWSRQYKIIN